LLRGGLTFYAPIRPIGQAESVLGDIEQRARRPLREARSTLVVGMALMTS
jgi:hypothetical protein